RSDAADRGGSRGFRGAVGPGRELQAPRRGHRKDDPAARERMDAGPEEDHGVRRLHEPGRHDPGGAEVLAKHVLRGSPQASGQLKPAMRLLEVEGVTLQYKTPRHLVTAAYKVDFT